MRTAFCAAVFSALFCLLLSSCAEHLAEEISKQYSAPTEHTFAASFDKAWDGAVQAVSAVSVVKTLDRDSGLIVTEYVTIDQRLLDMIERALFRRSYKNSYSVTIIEVSPGRTRVGVQSQLMMEQLASGNREMQVEWLEAYMRQELFRRICQAISQDGVKCAALFPEGNSASCPPPGDGIAVLAEAAPVAASKYVVVGNISVKKLQRALQGKGYSPGPVDGVMGRRTRAALLRFQEDNKLEGGGHLTEATVRALEL